MVYTRIYRIYKMCYHWLIVHMIQNNNPLFLILKAKSPLYFIYHLLALCHYVNIYVLSFPLHVLQYLFFFKKLVR